VPEEPLRPGAAPPVGPALPGAARPGSPSTDAGNRLAASYPPLMASVADLVEAPELEQLTGSDAHAAGTDLADAGDVRLVEFGPVRVVAKVADGGGAARVELGSADGQLAWSCDCAEGVAGRPCRHVAAAGIETWRRAPKRRA
jgi:uncharacterized Zn finger protein